MRKKTIAILLVLYLCLNVAFSFAGQTGKPSIRQDLNIDDIVIIYRP